MYKKFYDNIITALKNSDINIAIQKTKDAIDTIPDMSISYLVLMYLYLKKNDLTLANCAYENFKKINPNYPFKVSTEIIDSLEYFITKQFIDIPSPIVNDDYISAMHEMKCDESMYIKNDYIFNNDINSYAKILDAGLEHYPESINLKYNKSASIMRSNEIEKAWDLYELREKIFVHHMPRLKNIEKYTLEKENINLLVYYSAGFGDTIFYSRYLDQLKNKNINLYIDVQSPLKTLYKNMGYNVIDDINSIKFDYQISFMSLGWLFNTSLDTIPNTNSYIYPSQNNKINLPETKGKKIGIIWKSGSESNRSYTLENLLPLFEMQSNQFYSLQKEITLNEKDFLDKYNIINLSDELNDFLDTANYIDKMDIIIGCDTAVTNLSCAMGKKTCIILPVFCDYRWGMFEFSTPWYKKAKLFRQIVPGNWNTPIKNLINFLQK